MSRQLPDEVRRSVVERVVNKRESVAQACRAERVNSATGGSWLRAERDLVLASAERWGLEQAARHRGLDPERVQELWATGSEPQSLEDRVQDLEQDNQAMQRQVQTLEAEVTYLKNQLRNVTAKLAEHMLGPDHSRGHTKTT